MKHRNGKSKAIIYRIRKKSRVKMCTVVQNCNPSTHIGEAEAEGHVCQCLRPGSATVRRLREKNEKGMKER